MKTSFQKLTPKVMNYRNYNKYCNAPFQKELVTKFLETALEEGTAGSFL